MKVKDTGGGDFEQIPVGSHVARCVRMIDIGTQKGEYNGQATFKRQIIIGWELPNELMTKGEAAGKPFLASKFYTASLSEKATLRADLKNWRGRDFSSLDLLGFDMKQILDKPCMLSITHNDKGKAKVSGVMSIPKGMTVPNRISDIVYFSMDSENFKMSDFERLSDGYKKMIQASPEWAQLTNPQYSGQYDEQPRHDSFEDDLPF